ncbi:anti-sigma factor antagonist [Streptomyces sp. MS1.AVA.4]|uniref:STAS domain-containing protein n=1 Tax=Streptomyces pratisoli TaxID=3139917 RepID=A0ACC6QGU9_9ACTN
MMHLTVSSHRRDGWSVVTVAGELDIATAGLLGNHLEDVGSAHDPVRLIVDLSVLAFCDASGLRVLVDAHDAARRRCGELRLVCPDGMITYLLRITGLIDVIPVHATLPEALAATPSGLSVNRT